MSGIKGIKISEATRKKLSDGMNRKWKDPEYRARMVERQKKAGLR